jgi:hypothetical protein
MNRMNPRLLILAFLASVMMPAATHGQSFARVEPPAIVPARQHAAGAEALAALRRLQERVIVYRSQAEFEAGGRLAQIPIQAFESELMCITAQLGPIMEEITDSKVRTEIMNVLASYRDGLHWWKKVDRPRVVHVSMFKLEEDSSPADRVLRSTAAYTVAIHWRQAARYLQRAEAAIQGFASKLKTPQSVD